MVYTLRKSGEMAQNLHIKGPALTKGEKAEYNRRARVHGHDSIEDWIVDQMYTLLGYMDEKLPIFQVACLRCGYSGDTSEEEYCPKCEIFTYKSACNGRDLEMGYTCHLDLGHRGKCWYPAKKVEFTPVRGQGHVRNR